MPAQPVQKLRVVTASVRGKPKPDLQIAFEPFYVIVRELYPLFRKHWKELAVHKDVIPLDPNWEVMMAQAVNGILHVLTVRDDGDLVGYIFNVVGPHCHYKSTLHCLVDMFWLDPRYRRGWFPMKMFIENEKQLRKLNVVRVLISEKLHWHTQRDRRVRLIFKRMGYKAADVIYSKILEN